METFTLRELRIVEIEFNTKNNEVVKLRNTFSKIPPIPFDKKTNQMIYFKIYFS